MNVNEQFNVIEGEEWRTLSYLPDTIQVSSMGRVKEFIRDEWFIKPGSVSNGLKNLSYKGKSYPFHKLVADAFIPKDNKSDTMIKHLNGDKLDNSVSNLARMSSSEIATLGYKKAIGNRMKLYCSEHGIVYGSLRTAAFCNGLLESALSACIDTNSTIAGLHFYYLPADDKLIQDKPVVYMNNVEILDMYKEADSEEHLAKMIAQAVTDQLKVES